MRARYALPLLLALLLAACGAPEEGSQTGDGATVILPGLYVPLKLAKQGDIARFALTTEREGFLVPSALFPSVKLGALKFAATTAGGEEVNIADEITEPAGEYRILVSAEGASPEEFAFKVELAPSFDAYEPNNDEVSARAVELPFRARLDLHGESDQDWFKFSAPASGVLQIEAVSGSGALPLVDVFAPGESDPVRLSAARRYFPAKEGEWRVKLAGGAAYPIGAPEGLVALNIRAHNPEKTGGTGLIVVGLKDDDPVLEQLRLLMRSLGTDVTVARTGEEIAAALAAAAEPPASPFPWGWLAGGALVLALAGAGAWFYVRSRKEHPRSLPPQG